MDPTEAELTAIDSLDKAGDWAGTTGPLQDQLLIALGKPSKLRDIAFVSRPAWDRVLQSFKIIETDAAGVQVEWDPSATEAARIEIFRRVVFLRLGATPDGPGMATAPPITAGAAPLFSMGNSPSSPGVARKVKLSSIIDPTLDSDVQHLGHEEVNDMFKRYREKFGDHPAPDCEPSLDQLSGLKQLISSGGCPFVGFSIFTPHGIRALRKACFTSFTLNSATGEWTKKESPGPENFASWEKCFKTFKVAMLLLETIDSERLDGYLDHIKGLYAQFGQQAWGVLYKADMRMRSEFHERIRRRLDEAPAYGYTRASPWSAVYAASIKESEFWSREVITPATLLLARTNAIPPGRSSSEERPSPKKRRQNPGGPASSSQKKAGKRKYTGEDKSVWDDSLKAFSNNRKGINFNEGKCGTGRPQSRCTAGRSHQCNRCLGPHMGKDCKKSWSSTVTLTPASETKKKMAVKSKPIPKNKKPAARSDSSKEGRPPIQRKAKFAQKIAKGRKRQASASPKEDPRDDQERQRKRKRQSSYTLTQMARTAKASRGNLHPRSMMHCSHPMQSQWKYQRCRFTATTGTGPPTSIHNNGVIGPEPYFFSRAVLEMGIWLVTWTSLDGSSSWSTR